MMRSGSDGSLSPDMLRCLQLLAEGQTLPRIATALAISEKSVTQLVEAARDALNARNSVHAVNIAIRKELI